MSTTTRFSKRGRNPGAADCWLESLGFYRKNVAYDETCLFRAVSEQIFSTQIKHEVVRQKCVRYGKNHSKEFQHLVQKKKDWFDRMKKLSMHMVVCTETEVQLVCNTFQVDIKLFNSVSREIEEFRNRNFVRNCDTLLLCKMGEDHFDAMYTKEFIANAGFSQSIVYNVLYERVFQICNVEVVVHSMLHDKQANYALYYPDIPSRGSSDDELTSDFCAQEQTVVAPFPFKIAKALDPNMYRNIEYDTWLEFRREMRLGEWYLGDDKLILGTRCVVTLGDDDYECYIQAIFENDSNECEIYVTKLAKRLTVAYEQLRPEHNAKPWPLPYRFSRNQPVPIHNNNNGCPATFDNERKTLRKRREKRNLLSIADGCSTNVANFEGPPLLMRDVPEMIPLEQLERAAQGLDFAQESEPEETYRSLADLVPWSRAICSSQEEFKKIAIPTISSALPLEDTNDQQGFGYNSESGYPSLPSWPTSYTISPDSGLSESESSPQVEFHTSQKYVCYQPPGNYGSPTYLPPPSPHPFSPFPAATYVDNRAQPPPLMYYPMSAPTTPLYFPHPGTPQLQEFMVPTPSPTHVVNNSNNNASTMDTTTTASNLQYVTSPTYMYHHHPPPPPQPATPPIAWYNPPHLNSHGFIFPSVLNATVPATTHNVNVNYL